MKRFIAMFCLCALLISLLCGCSMIEDKLVSALLGNYYKLDYEGKTYYLYKNPSFTSDKCENGDITDIYEEDGLTTFVVYSETVNKAEHPISENTYAIETYLDADTFYLTYKCSQEDLAVEDNNIQLYASQEILASTKESEIPQLNMPVYSAILYDGFNQYVMEESFRYYKEKDIATRMFTVKNQDMKGDLTSENIDDYIKLVGMIDCKPYQLSLNILAFDQVTYYDSNKEQIDEDQMIGLLKKVSPLSLLYYEKNKQYMNYEYIWTPTD